MVETYKNHKGQIAILVSGGYGAGWSTWNDQKLAYDKRVVEYWLSKREDEVFMQQISSYRSDNPIANEAKEYFKSIGYTNVYFGGFDTIHIEWIEPGTPFYINEYDGYETLEVGYGRFERLV